MRRWYERNSFQLCGVCFFLALLYNLCFFRHILCRGRVIQGMFLREDDTFCGTCLDTRVLRNCVKLSLFWSTDWVGVVLKYCSLKTLVSSLILSQLAQSTTMTTTMMVMIYRCKHGTIHLLNYRYRPHPDYAIFVPLNLVDLW